jgi:hypothetical protein
MERERRTVFLAALSLLMYGLVSALGGGPFAFFPLNEIIFIFMVIYFTALNFSKAKTSYLILLSFALLSLIYNHLFLNFFMNSEQMVGFYENPLILKLKIASYCLLLIEIVRFYQKTAWKFHVYTMPLSLLSIGFGVYFNLYLFQTLGLLTFLGTLYFYYRKTANESEIYPKSLFYIWYFYTFLKLSSLFTTVSYTHLRAHETN